MSSIRAEMSGDTDELLQRLNRLSHLETRGVLNSIAEGLRTSTVERFTEEKTPEGTSWKPSIRAQEEGGKTLTKTTQLKTSIRSEVSDSGLAVGTNDIRAATHQFGDERTIRAKNKKYLTFKIGGQWKRVASVKVSIPPRPFLGISEEDEQDIKDTFERLGIPQAERKSLAGVGAQYDSELVYHNVREEVAAQGVVYTDMESALKGEYADMVQSHFMKLVKPNDHKFAALHGAVWSGGSFVYVPPGVSVTIPLQSYFRLNAPGAGQFEHTLIIVDKGAYLHFIEGCSAPKYNVANLHAGCVELFVEEGATLRYSTIENWSKNMYNLNLSLIHI